MIHPRVTFVTADYIATTRGLSVEAVYDLVDGVTAVSGAGDAFMWVFDVAGAQNVKRELRFWSREINQPETTRSLKLEEVVRQIIPRRDALPGQFCGLRNWEVGELLRVTRPHLVSLRDELQGEPRNGGIYVPRTALENFLTRRWCYATAKQPGLI